MTTKELALHNGMRVLWEDHVTWTRLAVISLVAGTPDTEATVARLLKNQTDIGNAIKPYYGAAAGNALTKLLRQHILIAADLIAAAKAGDQAKVAAEQARWRANADDIATFLARPTRGSGSERDMRAMLNEHLRLTTAGSGRPAPGQVGGRRRRLRPDPSPRLGMADTLSDRPRRAVPGAVPVACACQVHRAERQRERLSNAVVAGAVDHSSTPASAPRSQTRLARDPRYDLHALIELVERGCPPELAVRILAPLEGSAA